MIVVLNGASSAGKTTLARAIQDAWAEPALILGIDTLVAALPRRYLGALWSTEVFRYTYAADGTIAAIGPGPLGDRLVRGLHRAIAGMAASGVHVLVDHVLVTPSWAADLLDACRGLPLRTVLVTCPPAELERRERDRGDRTLGQATALAAVVGAALVPDLVVDTSTADPAGCAARVLHTM